METQSKSIIHSNQSDNKQLDQSQRSSTITQSTIDELIQEENIYIDAQHLVNEPLCAKTNQEEVISILSNFRVMKKSSLEWFYKNMYNHVQRKNLKTEYLKFKLGMKNEFDLLCTDIIFLACAKFILAGEPLVLVPKKSIIASHIMLN